MSERTNAPSHPCFKRRVSIWASQSQEQNQMWMDTCLAKIWTVVFLRGWDSRISYIVFVGFKLFQINLVVDLSRICILVYFEAWYQRILWVDFGAQLALETIGRQRLWQMDGVHPHIYSFLWTFVKSSKYVKIAILLEFSWFYPQMDRV